MDEEDSPEPLPGLILMPDHGADVPVRHGPDSQYSGQVDADQLMALGVSRPLVERLRAWQEGWDHDPFTSSAPREFWPGSPLTVRLARQLQVELPGYRIFLDTRSGRRPVDEWAG